MDKKVLLPLLAVIVFIILVGLLTTKGPTLGTPPKKEAQNQSRQSQTAQQKIVTVASKKVYVEVANTESLRQKGLGERTSLESDAGMLFVFDTKPVRANFWMKDMFIPIDIIWIAGDKVVKIDKNIPFYPPDTPNNQLKIYDPGIPIDYVLEVNSGFSDRFKFKEGDTVILPAGL